MTKPRLAFVTSLVAGLLAASPAFAQLEPTPMSDPAAPGEPAMDSAAIGGPELSSLVPPLGALSIRVPVVINMSKSAVAKPVSLPVDVYFGLNDALTVGLTHSMGTVQAVSPYWALPPGRGICLGGADRGCPDVYNNIGLDAIYRFLPGIIQLAGHGGLEIASIDPMHLALRIGLLAQAPLGDNVAILTDPRLLVGLNDRDAGNEDSLWLPLAVQFWLSPTARLAARTQLSGPLDGFGDAFFGSLGAFAGIGVNQMIEAFVSFDFLNLYGKKGPGVGAADARALVLGLNFNY